MDIDYSFKTLYKLDQEYLNNPENFCEICCSKLDENNIKLDCNHCFHYECLLKSMKQKDIRFFNMECPYCREKIDFLPLLPGEKPIKNLHKEYNEYIQKENNKYTIGKNVLINSGKYKDLWGIIESISDKLITLNINSINKIIKTKKQFVSLPTY